MKTLIVSLAEDMMSRGLGVNAQTPLQYLKQTWEFNNSGAAQNKNPYFRMARNVAMLFPKMRKEDRYAILTNIFDRPIISTYDLKLAEAIALLQMAHPSDSYEVRPEFTKFILNIKETVSAKI